MRSETVSYRDRIYENYASNFQDASSTFDPIASRRWGRALKYRLRHWLPTRKDGAIADVACGGAKLLHFLKEQGYTNIDGVDLSPEQVRIARQVIPSVCEENALAFLQRHPGKFDLITGFDVIEHLDKPEVLHFLDAAYAALRLGGRLILQTPNSDSPMGMAIRYGDFTHEVCFNPNSLSRLMRLAGFEAIEAREMGPVPWGYSVKSTMRAGVWQCFRAALKLWNIAELGHAGHGVFSRVFLITGMRR
jgi:2-polyprenyl-3-methyl-5-hydroxy-6-metoxy-1,4-benzoquinol methylase